MVVSRQKQVGSQEYNGGMAGSHAAPGSQPHTILTRPLGLTVFCRMGPSHSDYLARSQRG